MFKLKQHTQRVTFKVTTNKQTIRNILCINYKAKQFLNVILRQPNGVVLKHNCIKSFVYDTNIHQNKYTRYTRRYDVVTQFTKEINTSTHINMANIYCR